MKNYKAIARAVVATGLLGSANFGNAAEVSSGWWDEEKKAVAELEYLLNRQLAAGCYNVQTIIIERNVA